MEIPNQIPDFKLLQWKLYKSLLYRLHMARLDNGFVKLKD